MSLSSNALSQEQARQAFQNARPAMLSHLAIVAFFYALFSDVVDSQLLAIWSIVISLLAISRFGLFLLYKKKQPQNIARWLQAFTFITLLIGISWACFSLFYLTTTDAQIQVIFIVVSCGVMAAAVPVLAAWTPAFLANTVPQAMTLIAMLMYSNSSSSHYLAFALAVFYFMLLSLHRNTNQTIRSGFQLQHHNDELVLKLNSEIEQREHVIEARTEQLNENIKRLDFALRSARQGWFDINVQTGEISVSDEYPRLLGFNPAHFHPTFQMWQDNIHPDDKEVVLNSFQQCIDTEQTGETEYRIKTRNGGWLWIHSVGGIVAWDKNNKPLRMFGIHMDITERKETEGQLHLMAHYDVLTNLPNRALFADRFKQAVAHSNRTESMLAICFLDLDNFKPVNDNYGHEVGDQLLIEVATRIKETIREEDTVSRQGGDEFTLILRDIESFIQCEQLLERIRYSLAQPYLINDYPHKISVSIGTTIYPLDDADLDTLIRHADHAMYQAKLAGKNQQQLFNALDDRQTIQRQDQLNEIQQALNNKEFKLYYQPKVNMKKGTVFGVEALIRWFHPEKGMVPPLDFLPLIDGNDLEIQVGGWVINEALQQLDHWKQQGIDLEVSINVSSHHLQSAVFFDQLNEALDNHPNVNSQDLELEILESSALGDINAISGIIKGCQEVLGIQVALDDFGTGYSSLTHLRNLSAGTIKIDQSFVRNMLEDEDDLALIEGIIGLSKTFDRKVIAEGVETAEHGVLLMRIGCNCAQGYGIARPMPADEIPSWLQNYKPDESWSIWAGSEWEMSNLPLVVAQSDHMKWIEEIFNALEGHELGLDHGELTNHYECRLGNWYYGHGEKHYGHLDAFRELEATHVDVHKIGYRIIQLYNDGKKDEAVLLAEDLLVLKSKVLDSLNTLQKQVNFSGEK